MPSQLTPLQERSAGTIWGLARQAGLSPQRQLELAAIAKAESNLDPTNYYGRSSGGSFTPGRTAGGLFQLLSSGYVNRARSLGGILNPVANTRAILPDYIRYWKEHPNALPGEAGRDVERSGMGASFYSAPLAAVKSYYAEWGQDPNLTKELADYGAAATDLEKRFADAGVPGSAPQLSQKQRDDIEAQVEGAMPQVAGHDLLRIGGVDSLMQKLANMPIRHADPNVGSLAMGLEARRSDFRQKLTDLAKAALPKLAGPAPVSDASPPPEGDVTPVTPGIPKDWNKWVGAGSGMDREGMPTHKEVIQFVGKIGKIYGDKLNIGTGSNHREFVSGTNHRSDHWFGEAADIPMTGAALTRLGQDALIAAGMDPKEARKQTGGVWHLNGYNILFNTHVGGNHYNHLHVGMGQILGRPK